MFDVMCIFRTVFSAARHEGVVEGGTGAVKNQG